MPLDEKSMQFLEERIPELAEGAVKQAYYQALSAGCKVLEVVDGSLVETSSDGSVRLIRCLPESTPVAAGSKRLLRKTA